METETKPIKKRRRLWLAAAAAVLAAVLWLCATRVAGPGGLYPRDASTLDLRQEAMTPAEFDALQAKLPDCAIRWSVPIGDKRLDSESTTVHVGAFTEEDIPNFAYFTRLRRVDGANSESYEALLALKEARPDIDVKWGVDIGGVAYGQGCGSLRLDGAKLAPGELLEQLRWLPELKTVTVSGTMDPAEQAALMEAYPHITFDWGVALCGGTFRSTDTEISLAGQSLTEADLREIQENVFRFNALEVIDLTDCGFDNERYAALGEKTGANVIWTLDLFGVTVSTGDTLLDLSGHSVDVAALEEMLPWFFRLEKVDMCDCGVSDEDMDALNRKYENIRFVWAIYMGAYRVRTDAEGFICTSVLGASLDDSEAWKLRYCTDLLALDLGHRGVLDLSFVQYMPKLKYLIISCTPISDISPLAGHPSLVQVEAVSTRIADLSPLLECPALLDLNISFTYPYYSQAWTETLCQLTGLERLWYNNLQFSAQQKEQIAAALPDTQIYCAMDEAHCMGGTWRYHERYYEMRDILGMFYMAELGLPIGNIKRLPESE